MEHTEKDPEMYGIVVWDDGLHTMCAQSTAEYVKVYGPAIQGRILVDNLSFTEADVFMKLLPKQNRLNLTYDK